MMENPVSRQLFLFVASLLFGAADGVFYLLLGLLRKNKKTLRNAIADAIFWTVSAPAAFVFFMRINGGDVRGYLVAAMLAAGIAVASGGYFLFGRHKGREK